MDDTAHLAKPQVKNMIIPAAQDNGRKRGLAVDALGLIIAVIVTAASVTDNAIGIRLLDKVAEHTPTVTRAWVDAGFKQDFALHGAVLGIDVEVVKRSDTRPGFVPVKKRWLVEQVNGTLMLHRRLTREYESRPESSVSRTLWASTANIVRRLTGTSTRPGGETPMHISAILDLIAERQTTTGQAADRLCEQITALTTELARLDSELTDLETTRTTLKTLATQQFTDEDPTIASAPYQQILAVLTANPAGMRAKDICLAVGVDPAPKHVEGARARLKRMVNREILTENEPGIFILAPKRT